MYVYICIYIHIYIYRYYIHIYIRIEVDVVIERTTWHNTCSFQHISSYLSVFEQFSTDFITFHHIASYFVIFHQDIITHCQQHDPPGPVACTSGAGAAGRGQRLGLGCGERAAAAPGGFGGGPAVEVTPSGWNQQIYLSNTYNMEDYLSIIMLGKL